MEFVCFFVRYINHCRIPYLGLSQQCCWRFTSCGNFTHCCRATGSRRLEGSQCFRNVGQPNLPQHLNHISKHLHVRAQIKANSQWRGTCLCVPNRTKCDSVEMFHAPIAYQVDNFLRYVSCISAKSCGASRVGCLPVQTAPPVTTQELNVKQLTEYWPSTPWASRFKQQTTHRSLNINVFHQYQDIEQ
jgi:hypothetical protein